LITSLTSSYLSNKPPNTSIMMLYWNFIFWILQLEFPSQWTILWNFLLRLHLSIFHPRAAHLDQNYFLLLLHQWLARRCNLLDFLLARHNTGTSHKTLSSSFLQTSFGLIRLYHEYSSLGSRLYLLRISKKKRILRTLLCLSNYLVWAIALHPANMCATLSWPSYIRQL